MKIFTALLLLLLGVESAFGQGARPPVTTLSGLSDVAISAPVDNQPLLWNATLSKWDNSNTMTDILFNSSTLGPVANFSTMTLTSAGGDVINWSSGSLKVLKPMLDSSNNPAESIANRQLIGPDGTTVKIQWDGPGLIFPTLANTTGVLNFLATDSAGNVSLAAVPGAGAIPITSNILQGDGAGNAISTAPALTMTATGLAAQGTNNGSFGSNWSNITTNTAATVGMTLGVTDGLATILLTGSSYTTAGGVSADTLWINNGISGKNILVSSNGGVERFSSDQGATERARIGLGLAVGTPTDPGAGIVNAFVGYRINNVPLTFSGGTANQVLTKNTATDYDWHWVTPSAGVGAPGGSSGQVQWNNGGVFGGITSATTNGTVLTLTSPKIVTNILDANGVSILDLVPTVSAVNHLAIGNNVTNSPATLAALGTDTNINILLQPKGSGVVLTTTLSVSTGYQQSGAAPNNALLRGNGTVFASSSYATVMANATSPAGTTSTTGVMMGLGGGAWHITPTASGKVLVIANGSLANAVANSAVFVSMNYGTGTAPTNGQTATGTGATTQIAYVNSTAGGKGPFALTGIVILTPNTAYWFDLNLVSGAGGTATASLVTFQAAELP